MHSAPVIRIVAAVIKDTAGRILLVRKRGTTAFMQPGGKPEEGEGPADALARELSEELGITADPADFEYWGRFDAWAANESGHRVDAEVFLVTIDEPIAVAAEIEEAIWVKPGETGDLSIAPLTADVLHPRIAALSGRSTSE